jgi:hypothetical protein
MPMQLAFFGIINRIASNTNLMPKIQTHEPKYATDQNSVISHGTSCLKS